MSQITALCIVLGALLGLSLKTQRQAVDEGVPTRLPAIKAEFGAFKAENLNLQKELADYRRRYEKVAEEQARGVSSSKALIEALTEAKMLAGTTKLHGPGVIVTLRDSPKLERLDRNETRKEIIESYIIHDQDILLVCNELFATGAEAIAVNDQRIIASSSIRCVGTTVLINDVHVGPPFVIRAIGNADVLEKGIELTGGAADTLSLKLFDMIGVEKATDITLPAYTGSTRFSFAKPAEKE